MAYTFDGSTDIVKVNSPISGLSNGLSMGLWFRCTTTMTSGQLMHMMDLATSSASSFGHLIRLQDSAGVGRLYMSWRSTTSWNAGYSAGIDTTYDNGNWHSVVGTVDANPTTNDHLDLYYDGSELSLARSGAGGTVSTTDSVVYGARPDGPDRYFNGELAHLAVWETRLTTEDILQFDAGVCPLLIRPDKLRHYIPLLDAVDKDVIYGSPISIGGTPAQVDTQPVIFQPHNIPLVTETGFRITSVSSDDVVLPTEDPWNIAGRGFGAR